MLEHVALIAIPVSKKYCCNCYKHELSGERQRWVYWIVVRTDRTHFHNLVLFFNIFSYPDPSHMNQHVWLPPGCPYRQRVQVCDLNRIIGGHLTPQTTYLV